MNPRDKARCRLLVETAKFLFPDTVNLVPIVMSALNGRANPATVREWIEDDCPLEDEEECEDCIDAASDPNRNFCRVH